MVSKRAVWTAQVDDSLQSKHPTKDLDDEQWGWAWEKSLAGNFVALRSHWWSQSFAIITRVLFTNKGDDHIAAIVGKVGIISKFILQLNFPN